MYGIKRAMTRKVKTKKMNKIPAKDLLILSLIFTICIYLTCNTITALCNDQPQPTPDETARIEVEQSPPVTYDDILYSIKKPVVSQENTETETETETVESEPIDIYSNFKLSQRYKIDCLMSDGMVFPEGAEWGVHEPLFYDVELSDELQYYTYELCIAYGIGEYYDIILGIMARESGYDADVISKTKDYGIMQINKTNHKWISEEIGTYDYINPEQGILAGIHYAAPLLKKYPDDLQYALLCYRRGPTGAKKYRAKGYKTDSYVEQILDYIDTIERRE